MELILQQQLPHQQKAIDAIVDVFCGAYISAPTQFYTNPTFSLADTHIATNIKRLQSELPPEYHSNVPVSDSEYLNLDIKMETGTGKTYTVHFRDQLGNKQMAQIISEIMRGEN